VYSALTGIKLKLDVMAGGNIQLMNVTAFFYDENVKAGSDMQA
jgi:hypothetical protein